MKDAVSPFDVNVQQATRMADKAWNNVSSLKMTNTVIQLTLIILMKIVLKSIRTD